MAMEDDDRWKAQRRAAALDAEVAARVAAAVV
jgi:hypothetical protein